jgi:hypothetical protein
MTRLSAVFAVMRRGPGHWKAIPALTLIGNDRNDPGVTFGSLGYQYSTLSALLNPNASEIKAVG